MHGLFIDVGEYKCNSFALAGFYQILKCIHGSTVKCRDASHTENQTAGKVFDNDMFNGISGTKEQWSGDLVNTDLQR